MVEDGEAGADGVPVADLAPLRASDRPGAETNAGHLCDIECEAFHASQDTRDSSQMISRRQFVTGGAMTAAALMGSKDVFAIGPEPAIGLQLYSVRKLLEKDYVARCGWCLRLVLAMWRLRDSDPIPPRR